MKELSLEEKAKRYDEALERAKIWQEHLYDVNDKDYADELNYIFPELAESEDERIRKILKDCIIERYKHSSTINGVSEQQCIAWLEKQGTPAKLSEEEQNKFAKGVLSSCALSFINYLDAHRYEGKMDVSNGECEDIENAFHNAMWDRLHRYYCKYIEKQGEKLPAGFYYVNSKGEKFYSEKFKYGNVTLGIKKQGEKPINDTDEEIVEAVKNTSVLDMVEQKPAWSEEDEEILNSLISSLARISASTRTDSTSVNYTFSREIAWLKSLRPQNHWKPSEQDIQLLERIIAGKLDPMDFQASLNGLLEQLKKL